MRFIEFLEKLFHNRVLMSAVTAWAIAQVLKTIIHRLINGEWKAERMWGSGGMPSSHAATVCAMAVAAVYNFGPGSFEFAISVILAIIVLHDARGVRLEAGKQAEVINDIMAFLRVEHLNEIKLPEVDLKELVGHTPFQVAVGSAIGILTGIFYH